ncbi:hypothetical protein [Nonomuraea polychroma]|uniref:hypothetical protein n=1 Tax=Nonomuraea polychroma TaxID=46176 RepID=UPI0013E2D481|nr:hypothetical protein [Nonomuraea polychroma]
MMAIETAWGTWEAPPLGEVVALLSGLTVQHTPHPWRARLRADSGVIRKATGRR